MPRFLRRFAAARYPRFQQQPSRSMSESTLDSTPVNYQRMPASLREHLTRVRGARHDVVDPLAVNAIHRGDASKLLPRIERDSVALSVWSPPYYVGKSYEAHLDFDAWQS